MAARHSLGLSFASRRCISTSSPASCAVHLRKPLGIPRAALQPSFRRAYSDAPSATLSPTPRPKKRFRLLRWTWRLTYLSAIGLVGWLAYKVWESRNPNDQFEPDPSKKTLVILGRPAVYKAWLLLTTGRNGLGLRITTEEARHGKLQCRGYLSAKLFSLHSSPTVVYDWDD